MDGYGYCIFQIYIDVHLDWRAGTGHEKGKWTCKVCNDHIWREPNKARRHESQENHKQKAALYQSPESRMHTPDAHASHTREVTGPLAEVLASVAAGVESPIASSSTHPSSSFSDLFGHTELDMDIIMDALADDLEQNRPKDTIAHMSRTLLDFMNGDVGSEDSEPEDPPPIRIFDDFHTGAWIQTHWFARAISAEYVCCMTQFR